MRTMFAELAILVIALTFMSISTNVSLAFSVSPNLPTRQRAGNLIFQAADPWNHAAASDGKIDGGSLERIEFKIYPDGRVEETVYGVKGNNCHKVTEKINELLGQVVATSPTPELYEQELVMDETLYNRENTGNSWEGNSSW